MYVTISHHQGVQHIDLNDVDHIQQPVGPFDDAVGAPVVEVFWDDPSRTPSRFQHASISSVYPESRIEE
jgi:hypothetical protein